MGRLLIIQIIIFVALGFTSKIVQKFDKEIAKLLAKIDGGITALFILIDFILLIAGLKRWLV